MLLNTAPVKAKITPTKYDLPLGLLTRKLDSSGDKIPTSSPAPLQYELNPDLPALFQQFAHFIDRIVAPASMVATDKPQVMLYRDIYDRWISKYIVGTGQSGALAYGLQYDGAVLNTTEDLLLAFKNTQAIPSPDLHFMYIGLYMFVLWTFLWGRAKFLVDLQGTPQAIPFRLGDSVVRYVATKGVNWSDGDVSLSKTFFIQSSGTNYQASFLQAFAVGWTLQQMLLEEQSGDSEPPNVLPLSICSNIESFFQGGDEAVRHKAKLAFVRFFRSTLAEIVDQEYVDLLNIIDPTMATKVCKPIQFAAGNGGTTLGIFNRSNFGTLLWHYELWQGDSGRVYAQTKSPSIPVWKADGTASRPPSIFIAQWGADNPRSLTVTTTTDSDGGNKHPKAELEIQKTTHSVNQQTVHIFGSYLKQHSDTELPFDAHTSTLTINNKRTSDISVGSKDDPEEVTFLLFPHFLGEWDLGERLAIHQPFLDNEFVMPVADFNSLWNSQADQGISKAIVLRLRDNQGFVLRSRLSGGGVGRLKKVAAAGFGSRLEPASDQKDSNATAVTDDDKRYGYGEVAWWVKGGVEDNVLEFAATGFTSPYRCTWATWSTFQTAVTNSNPAITKATELQQDIGNHLTLVSGSPSYNTALSAFRAMGMLEAMVCRLQARADAMAGSEITDAERDSINARLQAFLEDVSIPIKQYLRKKESGITLKYVGPQPAVGPFVYYRTYAY